MNRFTAFFHACIGQAQSAEFEFARRSGRPPFLIGEVVERLYKMQTFQQTIENCEDSLQKMCEDFIRHIYWNGPKPQWLEAIEYAPSVPE